jgi:hypothetical protein
VSINPCAELLHFLEFWARGSVLNFGRADVLADYQRRVSSKRYLVDMPVATVFCREIIGKNSQPDKIPLQIECLTDHCGPLNGLKSGKVNAKSSFAVNSKWTVAQWTV